MVTDSGSNGVLVGAKINHQCVSEIKIHLISKKKKKSW